MIKKFRQHFLYKTNIDSLARSYGYPVIQFHEKGTDFDAISPVIQWDKLVNVKSGSILLLLEKIKYTDKGMILSFLFLDEIKIVHVCVMNDSVNFYYPYFEDVTE